MKADEFLNRAAVAERRVDAAMRKVELYKAMAEKVTSALGGEQVTHTRDVTANENAILRMVEAQNRVKELQAEYQAIVNEIIDTLAQLDEHDLEDILTYYYLNHLTAAAIATRMNISRSLVYRYQKQALRKLDALLMKSATKVHKTSQK